MLLFRQEEEAHTCAIGSNPRTARAPFLQCLSPTGRICVTLANTADTSLGTDVQSASSCSLRL